MIIDLKVCIRMISLNTLRQLSDATFAASYVDQWYSDHSQETGAMYGTITSRVRQLIPAFNNDWGRLIDKFGLEHSIPEKIAIVVMNDFNGSFHLKYPDGSSLIVIDRNQVLKAFLFSFFVVNPHNWSTFTASAILSLSAVLRRSALPWQDLLVEFAFRFNTDLAINLFNDVVDFITLHEIGHSYCDTYGYHFLLMDIVSEEAAQLIQQDAINKISTIGEFRVHPGGLSRWNTVSRDNSGKIRLCLPEQDKHEFKEFGPDVFALLARLVLDTTGQFDVEKLGALGNHLLVQILLMLQQETIDAEAKGGAWLYEIREVVRVLDSTKDGQHIPRASHPLAYTRSDVLYFHAQDILGRLSFRRMKALIYDLQRVYLAAWDEKLAYVIIDMMKLLSFGDEQEPENTVKVDASLFDNALLNSSEDKMYLGLSDHTKSLTWRGYGELVKVIIASRSQKSDDGIIRAWEPNYSKQILGSSQINDRLGKYSCRMASCLALFRYRE